MWASDEDVWEQVPSEEEVPLLALLPLDVMEQEEACVVFEESDVCVVFDALEEAEASEHLDMYEDIEDRDDVEDNDDVDV